MKRHKALITCQWLGDRTLSHPRFPDTHRGVDERLKMVPRYGTVLHIRVRTHSHSQHAGAWGRLRSKLPSCHRALMDGSLSHGCSMIGYYRPCNFSVAVFGCVAKLIWSSERVFTVPLWLLYNYNDVIFTWLTLNGNHSAREDTDVSSSLVNAVNLSFFFFLVKQIFWQMVTAC